MRERSNVRATRGKQAVSRKGARKRKTKARQEAIQSFAPYGLLFLCASGVKCFYLSALSIRFNLTLQNSP
jgi:hypothetical protein